MLAIISVKIVLFFVVSDIKQGASTSAMGYDNCENVSERFVSLVVLNQAQQNFIIFKRENIRVFKCPNGLAPQNLCDLAKKYVLRSLIATVFLTLNTVGLR